MNQKSKVKEPESTFEATPQLVSKREAEVLQLISNNISYTDIAKRLDIKYGTVKAHVEHVRHKLSVKTISSAVAEGIRRGIIK